MTGVYKFKILERILVVKFTRKIELKIIKIACVKNSFSKQTSFGIKRLLVLVGIIEIAHIKHVLISSDFVNHL